jgi:phage repressor protein C with HTH and peptisase S24 domain
MENISERVTYKMKELGLNEARLLRLMSGVAQSSLSNVIKGKSLHPRFILQLADALKTTPQWLLTGEGYDKTTAASKVETAPTVSFGPDTVPILGMANGGDPNAIHIVSTGDEIGRAPRHPNQAGMRNAFAVYTSGESMAPRYRNGELVYVGGGVPPLHGQDCVVELQGSEGYLKEFVKRTDKEVICRQHNPPKEWRVGVEKVKAIHAVVGRG